MNTPASGKSTTIFGEIPHRVENGSVDIVQYAVNVGDGYIMNHDHVLHSRAHGRRRIHQQGLNERKDC
jgi:hypothetical protein